MGEKRKRKVASPPLFFRGKYVATKSEHSNTACAQYSHPRGKIEMCSEKSFRSETRPSSSLVRVQCKARDKVLAARSVTSGACLTLRRGQNASSSVELNWRRHLRAKRCTRVASCQNDRCLHDPETRADQAPIWYSQDTASSSFFSPAQVE